MAGAHRRAAAGVESASAEAESAETTKPVRKQRRPEHTKSDHQAKVMVPDRIAFTVHRGETEVRLEVPTDFTIGQIVNQRVYDDLNAFGRLVVLEARNVAPAALAEGNALDLFQPRNLGYLEVALLTGTVAEKIRALAVAVGTIVETGDRPTFADLSQLSSTDTRLLGLWFFRRWLKAGAQAKNALRTA